MPNPRINIVTFIDVTKALSRKSLKGNVYMMDNSEFESTSQASTELVTNCVPDQLIYWQVYGIDVQTPATIRNVVFLGPEAESKETAAGEAENAPDIRSEQNSWTGLVPWHMIPFQPYRYRIEFQMGRGANSILSIDGPALRRVFE